ncbi:hypothetical protein J2Y48_002057 [Mycoplana sp. BE70]|nr:hypothetical protein [Mycoplana sp. BE70]
MTDHEGGGQLRQSSCDAIREVPVWMYEKMILELKSGAPQGLKPDIYEVDSEPATNTGLPPM